MVINIVLLYIRIQQYLHIIPQLTVTNIEDVHVISQHFAQTEAVYVPTMSCTFNAENDVDGTPPRWGSEGLCRFHQQQVS